MLMGPPFALPAPPNSPHARQGPHRGGRIVPAGHRFPHTPMPAPRPAAPPQVRPRLDPALGPRRNALRHARQQPYGPLEIDGEARQVPTVHADRCRRGRHRPLELRFGVHLDQDPEPLTPRRGGQGAEPPTRECAHDEEHRARPGRPRLEQLQLIEDEILAQGWQRHLLRHARQVVERAAEVRLVRQHGHRDRTPPRVRPRVLHGIEVFSDRSRGRGAPFYLGDHPKGAALQRPVEGTRRWGGGRPTLELSGLRPERGDARPGSGQDLIQRGGGHACGRVIFGEISFGVFSGLVMPVTRRQREILDFISTPLESKAYAPSLEETARQFGFQSLATVHEHLTNLERKGYIRRAHNESRAIEIVPPKGQTGATELPLLGLVAAGAPIEAISGDDAIAVPDELIPRRGRSYVLKVRGTSMIDEHIKDGDFIVVHERNAADNGQTVVALVHGQSATVKKFYREPGGWIRLEPANPAMTPLRVNERDILVQGIVVGVIRKY